MVKVVRLDEDRLTLDGFEKRFVDRSSKIETVKRHRFVFRPTKPTSMVIVQLLSLNPNSDLHSSCLIYQTMPDESPKSFALQEQAGDYNGNRFLYVSFRSSVHSGTICLNIVSTVCLNPASTPCRPSSSRASRYSCVVIRRLISEYWLALYVG